jgi:hypothetical protein
MSDLVKVDERATDLVVRDIEQARLLLAKAKNAAQAKQVADMALGLRDLLRRQKASGESRDHAHTLYVDATTEVGRFLKQRPKNRGAKGSIVTSGKRQPVKDDTPTLAEEGISKEESAAAQALADLSRTEPNYHEEVRRGSVPVTVAVKHAQRAKRKAEEAKVRTKQEAAARAAAEHDDRFRVERADCLSWFAAQPPDSITLVFGSPSYEDARLYLEDGADLGIARDTESWVAWMVTVYQAALRCCTGLVAFVVEGPTKNYRWSAGPALLMADLHRAGVNLRKYAIYQRVGIPGSGGPDWLRNDFESIICATRPGKLPWSDNTAMGEAPKYRPGGDPSHRTVDGRRVNENGTGRVYQPPPIANPGNVIACAVGGGRMGDSLAHENEAPFPEALAEFFVRSFCIPGGVVADPFCGSGTTGAVAVRHGRRFLGCDVRPSQVELSCERIGRVQRELSLVGE